MWVPYIFWKSNPCPRYHLQIYFPYGWFSFHFADVFFSCAEAFYLDVVLFVYSFLYVPCSREHISENIAAWKFRDFPIFSSSTFMVVWLTFVFYPSWIYFCVWCKLVVEFHFFACSCPIHLFLEKGKEKERKRNIDMREKHGLVASHTCPNQGPKPQPRHVPWPGIEQVTFCFVRRHPTNWVTLVRAWG